jgi:hypothetical protein
MTNQHLLALGFVLVVGLRLPFGCAKVTVEPWTEAAAGQSSHSGGATSTGSAGSSGVGSGGVGTGSPGGTTSTTNPNSSPAGGSTTTAKGGATGTGGAPATGGLPGTGGAPATGGAPPVVMPYSNDFESATALAGWLRTDNSVVSTSNHTLAEETAGSTNHVLLVANMSSDTYEVGGNATWTDQAIQVRAKPTVDGGYIYVAARYAALKTYYFLQLQVGSKPKIRARVDGSTSDVCAGSVAAGAVGVWTTLGLAIKGSTISATVDGTAVCTSSNASIVAGGIAIGGKGTEIQFDDLSVTLPP